MAGAATWEYRTTKMPGPPAQDDVLLNSWGSTGWEVVSLFVWNNERWALAKRLANDWAAKR